MKHCWRTRSTLQRSAPGPINSGEATATRWDAHCDDARANARTTWIMHWRLSSVEATSEPSWRKVGLSSRAPLLGLTIVKFRPCRVETLTLLLALNTPWLVGMYCGTVIDGNYKQLRVGFISDFINIHGRISRHRRPQKSRPTNLFSSSAASNFTSLSRRRVASCSKLCFLQRRPLLLGQQIAIANYYDNFGLAEEVGIPSPRRMANSARMFPVRSLWKSRRSTWYILGTASTANVHTNHELMLWSRCNSEVSIIFIASHWMAFPNLSCSILPSLLSIVKCSDPVFAPLAPLLAVQQTTVDPHRVQGT